MPPHLREEALNAVTQEKFTKQKTRSDELKKKVDAIFMGVSGGIFWCCITRYGSIQGWRRINMRDGLSSPIATQELILFVGSNCHPSPGHSIRWYQASSGSRLSKHMIFSNADITSIRIPTSRRFRKLWIWWMLFSRIAEELRRTHPRVQRKQELKQEPVTGIHFSSCIYIYIYIPGIFNIWK